MLADSVEAEHLLNSIFVAGQGGNRYEIRGIPCYSSSHD